MALLPVGARQRRRRGGGAAEAEQADGPGRSSETRYRVLQSLADGQAALVEARPVTGRTHQIRVHFAALGRPLLGDAAYGGARTGRRLAEAAGIGAPARPMLHAWRLALCHPASGAALAWSSPPPDDFCALLAALGGRMPGAGEEDGA